MHTSDRLGKSWFGEPLLGSLISGAKRPNSEYRVGECMYKDRCMYRSGCIDRG